MNSAAGKDVMHINQKWIRFIKWFSSLSALVIIVLALLIAGPRFLGLQVYSVLSGSMEPAYPTGSLLYVQDVDVNALQIDDVITFRLNTQMVATHRIVNVVKESNALQFQTKGDANESVDGFYVDADDVIGSPIVSLPFIGYIATYMQNPPGLYIAIGIGAILIALSWVSDQLIENAKESCEEN